MYLFYGNSGQQCQMNNNNSNNKSVWKCMCAENTFDNNVICEFLFKKKQKNNHCT